MAQRKERTPEQKIAAEYKNLKKSIALSGSAALLKIGDNLMREAAFMKVTLDDLAVKIRDNGCVSEYQNGENQWGTKKSPEVDVYNTMVKNYSAIMKQITDLLPEKTSATPQDDGFDEFELMRNG
jgi:hypothetical protein